MTSWGVQIADFSMAGKFLNAAIDIPLPISPILLPALRLSTFVLVYIGTRAGALFSVASLPSSQHFIWYLLRDVPDVPGAEDVDVSEISCLIPIDQPDFGCNSLQSFLVLC